MAFKITAEQAAKLIRSQGDKLFAVKFVKRTTGEERHMVCRLGVKKHLKGGPAAYDPTEKNLLFVFDFQKNDYRSIPLDNLLAVKVAGDDWLAVEQPAPTAS